VSDVRENCVSTKGKSAGENAPELRIIRISAATSTAVGLVLLAMSLTPVASGQSQAGSSSTPPQAAGQSAAASSSQTKGQASSQSEPQMQDQSAPPEESLAEAARKAKAQKTKSTTSKVYTEEKLTGLSGRGVSSVGPGNVGDGSSSSGDSSASSGASGAPPAGKSDEQYWRGRAQAIRDQMAGLDRQIAGIEEDIKAKGAVTVDPMSGVQAGVIYVEDRNAQIKQIEGQKAKLQDQLEALAEEGRKAGADSGWFR